MAALVASFALCSWSLSAQDGLYKAEQSFEGGFDGIEVGGRFNVRLEKADYYGAQWIAPEQFKDDVHVLVKGGVLVASVSGKGMEASAVKNNIKKLVGADDLVTDSLALVVYCPGIKSIVASGNASIDAAACHVESEDFMLDLTDNASVKGLSLNSDSATLTASKKAKIVDANVSAGNLSINSANMAEVTLSQTSKNLSVQANGTSVVNVNGDSETASVTALNSSKLTLEGSAVDLKLNASGREVHAEKLAANDAEVTGSNACKAYINVSGTLSLDLKGACSVDYAGSPSVNIVKISNSSVTHSAQ